MLSFHPFADIFPLLEGEALAELQDDIAAHGLRDPIWLYEGRILDGRNRYRACQALGVEPETREFRGADPLAFVLSLNLHRRHLNESQRAMVAARIANMPRGGASYRSANLHTDNVSLEQAGDLLGVSRRTVASAAKVQRTGAPELSRAVDAGEIRVSTAAEIAKLTPEEQKRIVARGETEILRAANAIRQLHIEGNKKRRERMIAEVCANNRPLTGLGKFALVYADPPWRYQNNASDVRRIENFYPTMSLEEICSLPVQEITHRDAILFLWCTVPQNEAGLAVLKAWGFEYKTAAAWLKEGGSPGMGHYFRVDHEYLLVGTRGSMPTPQTADRVSSIIRAPKRAHSEKPEEVYAILERFYPELPKIELFARQVRPGWAVWGNEVETKKELPRPRQLT